MANYFNSIINVLETACPYADKVDIQLCDELYNAISLANLECQIEFPVSEHTFIKVLDKVHNGLPMENALHMVIVHKAKDSDDRKYLTKLVENTSNNMTIRIDGYPC
jgi:hypothetical protein